MDTALKVNNSSIVALNSKATLGQEECMDYLYLIRWLGIHFSFLFGFFFFFKPWNVIYFFNHKHSVVAEKFLVVTAFDPIIFETELWKGEIHPSVEMSNRNTFDTLCCNMHMNRLAHVHQDYYNKNFQQFLTYTVVIFTSSSLKVRHPFYIEN